MRASGLLARSPSQCPQKGSDAHNAYDPRHIVGQDMQGHLGGDPWKRLHQEMSGAHTGFDCAEGMLNGLAPLTHLFWMLVEPALHGFEHMLVLPSRGQSFLGGSTAMLDGTTLTSMRPVATQNQASIFCREGIGEPFIGR